MSRSLSARLHRTAFSHSPSPSQSSSRSSPGARQYTLAALKTRPQSHQNYSRRQEDPPPYSRSIPREPDTRLEQEFTREPSRKPPPPERRRLDGNEDAPQGKGKRADAEELDSEQDRRGEGSSREVPLDAHRHAGPLGKQPTRRPSSPVRRPAKPDEIFSDHLNGLFSPLKFPPDLAARILTHASHPAAFHGHNAQSAFIGRRVLESYLLLLLTSSPHLKPSHDLQEIVSRVLNIYFLGEHIGSKWGLGRVMRWTPTIATSMLTDDARVDKTKLLKDVGLYKVQGDAVTAVIGGIFQQFGASVAHRVFHTRMLPRLLLPQGGLPVCFRPDANAACARLGGSRGDLVLDPSTPEQQEQTLEAPQEQNLDAPPLHRQTL